MSVIANLQKELAEAERDLSEAKYHFVQIKRRIKFEDLILCVPPEQLGARIAERRQLEGLTLRDAAQAIGIGFTTLHRVENGLAPNVWAYISICQWLLTEEPAPRVKEERNAKG